MSSKFLSIKGRFEKQRPQLASLPPKEQALCLIMFYAGFAACLEAGLELADIEERQAVNYLDQLHAEAKLLAGLVNTVFGTPPTAG